MTRFLRRTAAVLAALILIGITATLVFGVETRLLDGKLRTGDILTVPASETWDGNLYLFAGQVTVDGDVNGDLVAFGGTITINGAVTGDVTVGGGRVLVAGSVDGDVRAAGGDLEVTGTTTGDALVTGGRVTLVSGSSVGGDVIVSGGTVTVDGDVDGSVVGGAGTYSSSGVIGGENNVAVRETAPTENVVVEGGRQLLVIIAVGGLMLLFLPRVLATADTTLRTNPGGSLVGGILAILGYIGFVIATVVAVIVLGIVFVILRLGPLAAFSIVGGLLAIGVATYFFLLATAYLADVVVALGLAHIVARPDADSRLREWLLLIVGAIVVVAITTLPVVGGVAKLLVVLFGLGALAYAWWRSRKKGDDVNQSTVPAEPPPAPTPTVAG